MIIQIRKPENKGFYLGSNKKNNSGKEMNKIEGRFPKSKYKTNSLKIRC